MCKCCLCRGEKRTALSPAGFRPTGGHLARTVCSATWSCLQGLGAVEEFVKIKTGRANAAKTTMVEIVKVSKDGRDIYPTVEMYLSIGREKKNE